MGWLAKIFAASSLYSLAMACQALRATGLAANLADLRASAASTKKSWLSLAVMLPRATRTEVNHGQCRTSLTYEGQARSLIGGCGRQWLIFLSIVTMGTEPLAFSNVRTAKDLGFGGRLSKKSKRVGHSFELLPIEERIQQYREMADATLLKAQQVTDPDLRVRYLNMATSWHALVLQLEAGNTDPEIVPGHAPAANHRTDVT